MTMGAPRSRMWRSVSSKSMNVRCAAVGTPAFSMMVLANAFEPSSLAAACVGPKISRPRSPKTSTMPSTNGASGPTTVNSISRESAKSASSSISSGLSGTDSASAFVPPLPGAA